MSVLTTPQEQIQPKSATFKKPKRTVDFSSKAGRSTLKSTDLVYRQARPKRSRKFLQSDDNSRSASLQKTRMSDYNDRQTVSHQYVIEGEREPAQPRMRTRARSTLT